MSEPAFQTLNRAELLEELAKLGRPMKADEIDALADTGALPVGNVDASGFPMFALVQLVDGVAIRGIGDVETLRSRAALFRAALEGDGGAIIASREALDVALSRHAVLGEISRFLPVLEWAALDTLRGDARLDWRLRSAIAELRSFETPPEASSETARVTASSVGIRVSGERPIAVLSRAVSSSSTALSPAVSDEKAAQAAGRPPIAVAGPYMLGPEDFHPPGFKAEAGARVPVLREGGESRETVSPRVSGRTDSYLPGAGGEPAVESTSVSLSASSEQLAAGLAEADAHRRDGHHTDEEQTLQGLLESLGSGAKRLSVIRRLAAVYVARPGGSDAAVALYRDAIEGGEFDEKIVHALTSLLRASGSPTDVVEAFRGAAMKSEGSERRRYLRLAARATRDLGGDGEAAIELLERLVDESEEDGEVMLELAARLRDLGEEAAERAVLARARECLAIEEHPEVHYRVAELEFGRPRGVEVSSEILGNLLEVPTLPDALVAEAAQFARRVSARLEDDSLAERWGGRAQSAT
jgi:hypothetical protein